MRPPIQSLEQALRQTITLDIAARLGALHRVLQWYENAAVFVVQKLTDIERAKLSRARKVAELARKGATQHEAETAFVTAIRLYETLCYRFGLAGNAPTIDQTIADTQVKAAALAAERLRIQARYATVTQALTLVFQEYGITFTVNPDAQVERGFDSNRSIIFSQNYAEHLLASLSSYGIFHTVMVEVAPLVVKTLAVTTDSNGRPALTTNALSEQMSAVFVTMAKFIAANADAPSKTPPPPPDDAKIENKWFRGKMAEIFEFLLACGGITHVNEIRAAVPQAADVTRMLGLIAERGISTGLWDLRKYRNGYVNFEWKGKEQ